jgi:hypothetical protein
MALSSIHHIMQQVDAVSETKKTDDIDKGLSI